MSKIWLSIKQYVNQVLGRKPRLTTIMLSEMKYRIIFPCDAAAIRAANSLAFQAFGKRDHISENVIKMWLDKNPNILSVLVDSKFNVRGYFDIIPVRADVFDLLRTGRLADRQLLPEHILRGTEKVGHLYIGGITSTDGNPLIGSLLLTSLLLKVKYIYPKGTYVIGAVAATAEGRHYMEMFGFQKSIYPDAKDFYCLEVEPMDVDRLLAEIGIRSHYLDYSAYRWNSVHDGTATTHQRLYHAHKK